MNIAIWSAAVYCAGVVRGSPAVGEAKPTFRVGAEERYAIGRQGSYGTTAMLSCIVESLTATLVVW
jgi:hypothetical protein